MTSVEALLARARVEQDEGRYASALALLDEVIAALASAPPDDPRLLNTQLSRVKALYRVGRGAEAIREGRQLLARCANNQDPALHAAVLVALGFALIHRGDVLSAQRLAGAVLALAREHPLPEAESDALLLRSEVEVRQGRYKVADATIAEAAAVAHAAGLHKACCRILRTRAESLIVLGDLRLAAECVTQAMEIAERLENRFLRVKATITLGLVHLYASRSAEAAEVGAAAAALAEEIGDWTGLFMALTVRGDAATALGSYDEAEQHYRRGLELHEVPARVRATHALNLAILAVHRGRWSEAAEQAERLWAEQKGPLGAMASAVAFAAWLGRGAREEASLWERRARQALPSLGRAEPDLAVVLERGVAVCTREAHDPRLLGLAARGLTLAWATWNTPGREPQLARCSASLVSLAAQGAPVPVGPFDLLDPVGAGGMGEVWRARSVEDGSLVAIKLVTAQAARKPGVVAALRAEVRAVARLNHPNIVAVFDSGLLDGAVAAMTGGRLTAGSPYLVMALCEGNLLSMVGRLPWPACRELLAALLEALAHAHARGIVHLDIKPDNVLLSAGQPRLTDFGLARSIGEVDGRVCGTPAFMAPEQIRGDWRAVGPWTDLYALGCLAWTLLTGAPPFGSAPAQRVMERKNTEDPRSLQPDRLLPAGLRAWLDTLLARDPAARFACAADALRALQALSVDVDVAPDLIAQRAWTSSPRDNATFQWEEVLDPEEGSPSAPELASARVETPPDWRAARRAASPPGSSLATFGTREVAVIGREAEQDALWAALRGEGARAVVLTGSAGVGKTRLLQWLAHRASETGAATVIGLTGGELGRSLRTPLRWIGLEGSTLREAISTHLDLDDDALVRRIAELVEPGMHCAVPLSALERAATLRVPLARLARQRQILLVLDDAQSGADDLALIASLLDDPGGSTILAVIAARDDLLAQAPDATLILERLSRSVRAVSLTLPPLTDEALREALLSRINLDPALAAEVCSRAQGNPQFAIELVGDWVQRGLLTQGERGFSMRHMAVGEIPDGLKGVWSRRVDSLVAGLAPGAREALEVAATLGMVYRDEDWRGAAADLELGDLSGLSERLLDTRLAVLEDGVWRLAQAMFRETVLSVAEAAGRAPRWHEAIAQRLLARGELGIRLTLHQLGAGQLDVGLEALFGRGPGSARDLSPAQRLAALEVAERAMLAAPLGPDDPRWLTLWSERAGLLNRLGLYDAAMTAVASGEELARRADAPAR